MAIPQHVGELPHLLGVLNGLVEGLGKVVGAEDGQVGVLGLQVLVGVAVDHRQIVVVILLADKAAGVLAEGAHLVLKGLGIADELGLVEHIVHRLHHLVAHLHPDADVHGAGGVGHAVAGAELVEPVRAPAAGGHHGVGGVDLILRLALGEKGAHAPAVLDEQIGAGAAKADLHPMRQQVVLDGGVNLLGLFRAQVADGAIHQF